MDFYQIVLYLPTTLEFKIKPSLSLYQIKPLQLQCHALPTLSFLRSTEMTKMPSTAAISNMLLSLGSNPQLGSNIFIEGKFCKKCTYSIENFEIVKHVYI